MRRDLRVTRDIQKILFAKRLVRLSIPHSGSSSSLDCPSSGRLVVRDEDIGLCAVAPTTLRYFDFGISDVGSIENIREIMGTARSVNANAYLLGNLNFEEKTDSHYRPMNVPFVFYRSRKAEAAIMEHRPF